MSSNREIEHDGAYYLISRAYGFVNGGPSGLGIIIGSILETATATFVWAEVFASFYSFKGYIINIH